MGELLLNGCQVLNMQDEQVLEICCTMLCLQLILYCILQNWLSGRARVKCSYHNKIFKNNGDILKGDGAKSMKI